MRVDGEQNRQRILDAAELVFAKKGSAASVAEIVAAAGVTPPTLYRHFGDKDGLIKAIAGRRSEMVAANLARALSQPTGWEGLRVALDLSIEMARNSQAIREQPNGLPLASAMEQVLIAGWSELIERGQAEGGIRSDLTGADVPFLAVGVVAAALAADHSPHLRERYVTLFMDGLRPHSRAPLAGPPPTRRDVTQAFSSLPSDGDH